MSFKSWLRAWLKDEREPEAGPPPVVPPVPERSDIVEAAAKLPIKKEKPKLGASEYVPTAAEVDDENFELTTVFMHWLEKVRPGPARWLKKNGITRCRLSHSGRANRFTLTFPRPPGWNAQRVSEIDHAKARMFDRQMCSDTLSLVLDGASPRAFCEYCTKADREGFRAVSPEECRELMDSGVAFDILFKNGPKRFFALDGFMVVCADSAQGDIQHVLGMQPIFIREVEPPALPQRSWWARLWVWLKAN